MLELDRALTRKHHFHRAGVHAHAHDAITENPGTYGGTVILICWHHGKIPALAEAFGVSKSQLGNLDPWPGSIFDLLLQITWSGSQVNLAVQHQQLLFGDSVG